MLLQGFADGAMPGIVRKLLLIAAADGLILQPLAQRNHRAPAALKIGYTKHDIQPLLTDHAKHEVSSGDTVEVYGVVGLLKVASNAYLISISRRKQVAHLWGKPIFVITGIAIIPLASHDEATKAIKQAREEAAATAPKDDDSESSSGNEVDDLESDTLSIGEDRSIDSEDDGHARPSLEQAGRTPSNQQRQPGIVEDVIKGKGLYGRFTDRWFSRRGWDTNIDPAAAGAPAVRSSPSKAAATAPDGADERRLMDNGGSGYHQWPQTPATEKTLDETFSSSIDRDLTSSLSPKLLQTLKALLTSRTFHFSYDLDITRSLATQQPKGLELPRSRQAKEEVGLKSYACRLNR